MLNSCNDHKDYVVVHESFRCPVCVEKKEQMIVVQKLEIALDEYEEGSSNTAIKKSQ